MQHLPPLSWLRAFEAAARHLSFTQAAEELLLTSDHFGTERVIMKRI